MEITQVNENVTVNLSCFYFTLKKSKSSPCNIIWKNKAVSLNSNWPAVLTDQVSASYFVTCSVTLANSCFLISKLKSDEYPILCHTLLTRPRTGHIGSFTISIPFPVLTLCCFGMTRLNSRSNKVTSEIMLSCLFKSKNCNIKKDFLWQYQVNNLDNNGA